MIEEYHNKKVYTIFLRSGDKIAGSTNNNAIFNINFPSFLPQDISMYKLRFFFSTTKGYYRDNTYGSTFIGFAAIKILCDIVKSNTTFDTTTNSSYIGLGIGLRDLGFINTNTYGVSTISASRTTNPPITIVSPKLNQINVQLINLSTNALLVDTLHDGSALLTDASGWVLTLELEPLY